MNIYLFRPILKPVIWGGSKIARRKGLADVSASANIGESWEISGLPGHESVVAEGPEAGTPLSRLIAEHGADLLGERVMAKYGPSFPLLIKFIDARHDLSVQVHPDDELAARRHGCMGKTEMWYIMDAEPGAKIYAGLNRRLTAESYARLVAEKKIMDAVAATEVDPGDVFLLPPGCIHSIGAGCLLVEIQQASDITYRVYDYDRRDANGRPRQLHTAEAAEAIDFDRGRPTYVADYDRTASEAPLVQCKHFTTRRVKVDGEVTVDLAPGSFTVAICVDGECTLQPDSLEGAVDLRAMRSALIPAAIQRLRITGHAILLLANA